jgi:methionine sulfoxide reductase heme-binding subunit
MAPAAGLPTGAAIWALGFLPGAWAFWQWRSGALGVVPDEVLLHLTGRFALGFLIATLGLGLAHFLTGWRLFATARRPLGVWCFAYALAHASIWLMLDQGGIFEFALAEARAMVHVQLGLAALVLMLPLALSSFDAAPRKMGFDAWKRLHLLVWPAAALALAHAFVVSRFASPLLSVLSMAMAGLFAARLWGWWRERG